MTAEAEVLDKFQSLTKPDHGPGGSALDVQGSRAIAEVQAAAIMAKKFPRDEKAAYARIMQACRRRSLAEQAEYEYPRGGQKITGPSIRLAEAVAQGWGNLDTGVMELERKPGESVALAYCVDLETNYRKAVTFSVPHIRDKKSGAERLTESRDIYERVMNDGSRRLRNCIMAVVPGDIFDAALDQCAQTMKTDAEPLQDRIRKMFSAMKEFGVTQEMIERKFGCKLEALSENNMTSLRGIYQSIKDGVGSVATHFEEAAAGATAAGLKAQVDNQTQPATSTSGSAMATSGAAQQKSESESKDKNFKETLDRISKKGEAKEPKGSPTNS